MAKDGASRPDAKALRLFVAFEISEEAKIAIEEAVSPWRVEIPVARWTPRQNWHVTLKFLGDTWPRLVERVSSRIAEVAAQSPPFTTEVAGLGAFPSAAKARVIWAGLDDPEGRISQLAARLDAALKADFPQDKRPFHAHVTVARSDPPLTPTDAFFRTEASSVAFPVERIVLFRSHLRRPAPVYEPLDVYPLEG